NRPLQRLEFRLEFLLQRRIRLEFEQLAQLQQIRDLAGGSIPGLDPALQLVGLRDHLTRSLRVIPEPGRGHAFFQDLDLTSLGSDVKDNLRAPRCALSEPLEFRASCPPSFPLRNERGRPKW